MKIHKRVSMNLASVLIALLAIMPAAFAREIATPEVSESFVVWHPLQAQSMVLTVSGPSGNFRYEFEAGEAPELDSFAPDGRRLQDGNYTWQLVAAPNHSKFATTNSGTNTFRQNGYLTVVGGAFELPGREFQSSEQQAVDPDKVVVVNDDLTVIGFSCLGPGCTGSEVLGPDTLRLKDIAVRQKFEDTSGPGFPTADWQIRINDPAYGAADMFSIEDIDSSQIPFTIEGSAPSNSIYVDDTGHLGLGTATPAKEAHIVSGSAPTLRLEQDISDGSSPYSWDLAGDHTSFSIEDTTNGSSPFSISSGAPTDSLTVDDHGDVGIGTDAPTATLHVKRDNGTASIHIEEATTTPGPYTLLSMETSGVGTAHLRPRMSMTHGGTGTTWNLDILSTSGNFAIIRGGAGNSGPEFSLDATNGDVRVQGSGGNVFIPGNFVSNSQTLNVPDFVFDEDYELMPLDEVKTFIESKSHLPDVPSAEQVKAEGLDLTEMQLKLLQKVEELTLYTLDQHETIRNQQDTIQQLMQRLDALESAPR